MKLTHTFAGNPLNRGENQRRDHDWLERAARDPRAKYLPMHELNVLLTNASTATLGWVDSRAVGAVDQDFEPVFLGLDDAGAPHFAIDVSDVDEPELAFDLGDGFRFQDARSAAAELSVAETGIVAQSRAQLGWHRSHRFCSTCGAESNPARGGHVRICARCEAEHFPRTDPVAIMVIVDGERCLLGQSIGRLSRSNMYSALAGFIDQGESIEEAVRREVMEEAGIEVGTVRYHSSQPWPFPSSLMIGCHGRAGSTEVRIDPAEMQDVRWFEREDVARALRHEHPELRLPGPIAIAHHLIKAWVDRDVELD